MPDDLRRQHLWHRDNQIDGVISWLQGRFGDREASGSIVPSDNGGFRFRKYVKDLTVFEASAVVAELGGQARHVDLVRVARSMQDLRDLSAAVHQLIRSRPDRRACSGGSFDLGGSVLRLWIRPDAPELWQAVQ